MNLRERDQRSQQVIDFAAERLEDTNNYQHRSRADREAIAMLIDALEVLGGGHPARVAALRARQILLDESIGKAWSN
jgi:hypothetical protein